MKFRNLKDNDEAVLGYFFAFIFAVVMLVFLFSFAIPFMVDFTTDMYIASESIIDDTEDKIASITNVTIRQQIQNSIDNMQSATVENIDYLSFFYQYSWLFIVIVVTFTIFILARQTVETKGYMGGVV